MKQCAFGQRVIAGFSWGKMNGEKQKWGWWMRMMFGYFYFIKSFLSINHRELAAQRKRMFGHLNGPLWPRRANAFIFVVLPSHDRLLIHPSPTAIHALSTYPNTVACPWLAFSHTIPAIAWQTHTNRLQHNLERRTIANACENPSKFLIVKVKTQSALDWITRQEGGLTESRKAIHPSISFPLGHFGLCEMETGFATHKGARKEQIISNSQIWKFKRF